MFIQNSCKSVVSLFDFWLPCSPSLILCEKGSRHRFRAWPFVVLQAASEEGRMEYMKEFAEAIPLHRHIRFSFRNLSSRQPLLERAHF